MPAKPEPSAIDQVRIRFIEVLDAIMRENPKVRTVKAIAREIDCPYLSLHKVYNYRKYKTSYPSTEQIVGILRKFPTINPDFIFTGADKLFRDMKADQRLSHLEEEVDRIKRKLGIR